MQRLFQIFFSKLNNSRIDYAITGITNNYPHKINSDIDIIIASKNLDLFWKFMRSLKRDNINWVQLISHESTAFYCVITLSDRKQHYILKPDVCTDYYRNGSFLLSADYLLKDKLFNNKGFYELSPDKEFIYYLLKKIHKGSIQKYQFNHLNEQWNLDKNGCNDSLRSFFNNNSKEILSKSFESNDPGLLMKNLFLLRLDLKNQLKFNIKDFIYRIKNRIIRFFNPTGLVVAFMGPDGCGKTSVITGIKRDVIHIFRKEKQYHLFPSEPRIDNRHSNPHKIKNRNYFTSIIKLFYLLFIYLFGYYFKVYPYKVRSTFVSFDRYFHDFFVDQRRYRYGAGKIWLHFFSFFIPKPDLWILLDSSSEIIQKRKSEVSFKETERQVLKYRKLFKKLSNGYIINANQNLDKVIYDTQEVIINYMKTRTNNRYKNL